MMGKWLSAMVLVLTSFVASADDLGRLFFTPQERENMDRQRRGEKATSNSASAALNGYIKRSDGRNTVWVDGSPMRATDKQVSQTVVDGSPNGTPGVRIKQSAAQDPGQKAPAQKPPQKQPPQKKPQAGG